MTGKLFNVTIETTIVVAADTTEDAEQKIRQAIADGVHDDPLADMQSDDWDIRAHTLTHIPADWDGTVEPYCGDRPLSDYADYQELTGGPSTGASEG